MLNLSVPEHAYLFGFIQADGHLSTNTRNRGKLEIKVSIKDQDIIYKLQKIIPVTSSISSRIRNTNFKQNYESITLTVCDLQFRLLLNQLGIPNGSKSYLIEKPNHISEIDYWRGIIDGDGSLGLTKDQIPYVSLNTKSDKLAQQYLEFLEKELEVLKVSSKNRRDQTYNIMIMREKAKILASKLYYPNCLGLDRKIIKAKFHIEEQF